MLNDFLKLYDRFLAGTRYLNRQLARGANITRDKERFQRQVVDSMDEMYQRLTDGDKARFEKIACKNR